MLYCISIMNILIVYATNSGSTYEAAKIVRDILNEHKHIASIKSVIEAQSDDLSAHDAFVFGSCTWQWTNKEGKILDGELPQHFNDFICRIEGASLKKKHCAVFGMGDHSYSNYCAAAERLSEFVKTFGGTLVGEPLKVGEFFFDLPNNTNRVSSWARSISSLF